MTPTTEPSRNRRTALVVAIAALAALAVLLAIDLILWRTSGRDVVAAGVYAEIPSPEKPSPLALEPVDLPPVRVDLEGLTEAEASARLREAVGGEPGLLVLRDPDDDRTWPMALTELGLVEWAPRAAEAAYAVGRGGAVSGWLERQMARLRGRRVEVAPQFDAMTARGTLEALAPEVDVAPRDAGVLVEGDGATERPALLGHQLDLEGTLAALAELADQPASEVFIAIARTAPAVYDVRNVAAALDLILSGPLTMVDRRGQPFTVDAATVAEWFGLGDLPNADGVPVPSIVVDREAIRAWLTTLAPLVAREPTEGRYRWVDGRIEPIESPQNGHALDVEASIDRVVDAAYANPHLGELAVVTEAPRASSRAAEALLAVAPVARASTSLMGSPAGRLQSVELTAGRLDGSVVPPGAELSLRDALGSVTLNDGYDIAWLRGPRDWLDQVATTAFRVALQAGLPIPERHAPTWRSGWHEPPVGVDAAIDALGAPPAGATARDLRILNDTAGWLLFEVRVDPVGPRLTWSVWTVEEPRVVRLEGPTVTAVAGEDALEPLRLAEPGLPAGVTVQVGLSREGAEARLARTVIVGSELRQDAFESRYAPAPDVFVDGGGAP